MHLLVLVLIFVAGVQTAVALVSVGYFASNESILSVLLLALEDNLQYSICVIVSYLLALKLQLFS